MRKVQLKQVFDEQPANSVGLMSLLEDRCGHRSAAVSAVARLLRDHPDEAAIAVVDLFRQYEAEKKKARTDGMTGLFNKHYMMAQLGKLERGERPSCERRKQKGDYILFIDLDGFKPINDNYGHPAGDRALIAVADMLKKCVRKTDDVGRMGGDEFAVILHGISREDALKKKAQIVQSLESLSFPWQKARIAVRGSVGMWPFDTRRSVEDNMALVDKIMYRVKAAKGDTRHHLYVVGEGAAPRAAM